MTKHLTSSKIWNNLYLSKYPVCMKWTWAGDTSSVCVSVSRCAPSVWMWGKMSLWTHWVRMSYSKSSPPSPETHTHIAHLCVCVCGLVHVLSDLTVQTWNQYNPHRSPHPCSSCDLRPHRHTDRRKERAKNSAHGLPSPSCVCGCALSLTKCRVAMVPGV